MPRTLVALIMQRADSDLVLPGDVTHVWMIYRCRAFIDQQSDCNIHIMSRLHPD
jgi:hypothetical protein